MADHLDGSLLLWLDNEDVAPDLVAELDVSCLHSEVGSVASFVFGSLALDSDFAKGISLDLIAELDWLGANVISSGLEELHICWPGGFAIISEDPGLREFGSSLNFVFVIDAFLHEAGLVSRVLWLGSWGLLLDRLLFPDEAYLSWEGLVHLDVLVLADQFCWSELRLSNFEHGVTGMNSIAFAVLANIVIRAD